MCEGKSGLTGTGAIGVEATTAAVEEDTSRSGIPRWGRRNGLLDELGDLPLQVQAAGRGRGRTVEVGIGGEAVFGVEEEMASPRR
ncbi:hypothetical protein PR202_ga30351 [Eleusine coracana subsp. coracana]|uniref:Uncharacterized protein n=1 Tax=Eleusine coracana subsp. coracana TaxID=191504 RepID=A0AAV5DPQ8_ELECO|nr:hypothetical protein PR202_ga30351 [Eleusine coracana subsp. coracana]